MLRVGTVVRATAGRDKDKFFCIVELTGDRVRLADGKRRPLEHAKWKNVKHIRPTATVLECNALTTNKQLKAALRPFKEGAAAEPEEGGTWLCQKRM